MVVRMMKNKNYKTNSKIRHFSGTMYCDMMILSSDNWHVMLSIQLLALKAVEYMEFEPIWQINHPHSRFKGR